MDLTQLSAEIPRKDVSWRVQGTPIERQGRHIAMALAYIDARDVMDRLDEVCGPANWQSKYTETAKGRVLCSIGIRVGDEWVWKSDGAGDTAVEGEKGGISDSLKRAAVQWGIGRYLYRMDAPWVACEVNQKNGKTYFRKWLEDPWSKVKNLPYHAAAAAQAAPPKDAAPVDTSDLRDRLKAAITSQKTQQQLHKLWTQQSTVEAIAKLSEPHKAEIIKAHTDAQSRLPDDPALQAPDRSAA